MKKADFIRQGIADNKDMKPKELAEKLNEEAKTAKYDFKISPAEISTYKSKEKTAASDEKTPTKKTATFDFPAPTANGATPDVVSAAKAVKQLVDKFGADTVKGLAELFSAK